MGDLAVFDVDRRRAAVVRTGSGLDLALAEDHGPGVRTANITEEGRGAVARRGALPLEDEGSLVPVMGHFLAAATSAGWWGSRMRGSFRCPRGSDLRDGFSGGGFLFGIFRSGRGSINVSSHHSGF